MSSGNESSESPWATSYYAVTDADDDVIEAWPTADRAAARRDTLMPDREDGGELTVEEREDVPCYCRGERSDWEYHHPTGCGEGGQGYSFVTAGDTRDRITEPYTPGDAA